MPVDFLAMQIAARKVLIALPLVSGKVVRYEGVSVGTTAGDGPPNPQAIYLEEYLVPVAERHIAYGFLEGRGLIFYNIVYPRGGGKKDANALSLEIKEAFKPTTAINDGDFTSVVESCEERPRAVRDENWILLPIHITLRTHPEL